MRVAMVAERFDLHAGGAERSAAQIAVGLTRRGHRVTIIAGSCPDPQALPDVTVLAMTETKSASLIRFLRFVRWARRQLARGRFDVSLSLTTAVPATVVEPREPERVWMDIEGPQPAPDGALLHRLAVGAAAGGSTS